jgi:hypothetical protein
MDVMDAYSVCQTEGILNTHSVYQMKWLSYPIFQQVQLYVQLCC